MSRARAYAWPAGVALALAATLALGQGLGVAGRRYEPRQRVITVATPAEAYAALRRGGVRGRVVVLLDERTRVVPRVWMATFMDSLSDPRVEPPVLPHNFTSCFVYAGIARDVYFVPPAVVWEREMARLASRPDAIPEGNGARVRFYGVPIRISKPADLPVFREKVVVYIAASSASYYDPVFMKRVTDPRIADVVIRQVTK